MPEAHDHNLAERPNRVNSRGALLADLAVTMTQGIADFPCDALMTEAVEYLADAIAKVAVENREPRRVVEHVVSFLDRFPLEELRAAIEAEDLAGG